MLKYIKNHMTSIDGIEIYPIFSLTIFVLFFAVMLFWVFTADKKYLNKMGEYPLED